MIRRVRVANFKRFRDQSFDLADSVVLAGPNNSGKSTLMQAISWWKEALDLWNAKRADSPRSERRTGVGVNRLSCNSAPVRDLNLLWNGRTVAGGNGPDRNRLMEISVEGVTDGKPWECALEFHYAHPELAYVRPLGAREMADAELDAFPPPPAAELEVVRVPALSGVRRDEPLHAPGMTKLIVGESRAGDMLRNLLWEIGGSLNSDRTAWESLAGHVRDLFRIELLAPAYSPAEPYIRSEYREAGSQRPLDLASTGSGTLQVILLLAFLHRRRGTVLLLDEPDAHQHVILQRDVYALIRRIARERDGQVIMATHSPAMLEATEPERILSFAGPSPRPLRTEAERDRTVGALRRLRTTDLILGHEAGGVLYVEGQSDERILRAWTRVLDHPLRAFFSHAYVHWLRGRRLEHAREHHFALHGALPGMPAVCLLDGDNREAPARETTRLGMEILRWERYEIENYLLHPRAVARWISSPAAAEDVEREFGKRMLPGTELFGDSIDLVRVKGSTEFLLPLLEAVGHPTRKADLYVIAEAMKPEEIHPEVVEKLDRLAEVLTDRLPGLP